MIGASGQSDQIERNVRTWAMIALLVFCFLGLVVRLGWLQIVQGQALLRESEANRLRECLNEIAHHIFKEDRVRA